VATGLLSRYNGAAVAMQQEPRCNPGRPLRQNEGQIFVKKQVESIKTMTIWPSFRFYFEIFQVLNSVILSEHFLGHKPPDGKGGIMGNNDFK
ncbi:MAG: hypothetical protein K2G86_07150, partial [Prevotella sp.]|nr:hypothetical protein [Prevotella sp.]